MNIAIKATNLQLTQEMKDYAEEKIQGLSKFIDALEAKVELERDRKHNSGMVFRAEVNLIIGKKHMFADATGVDIFAAIDLVIPKIKEQISKFKDKKSTLAKRGGRTAKRTV